MPDMPHLETDQVALSPAEADKMRAAAHHAAAEPLREQVSEAKSFILQLQGLIAAHRVEVPPALEKDICAWLHARAVEAGTTPGRASS